MLMGALGNGVGGDELDLRCQSHQPVCQCQWGDDGIRPGNVPWAEAGVGEKWENGALLPMGKPMAFENPRKSFFAAAGDG